MSWIMFGALSCIFIGHYIADFLCQTNWMALNKSKSLVPLTIHVMVYSGVLSGFFAFAANLVGLTIPMIAVWVLVNASGHFVTDFITSRMSSKAYKNNEMRKFWAVIGVDQLIHLMCLVGSFVYLLQGKTL